MIDLIGEKYGKEYVHELKNKIENCEKNNNENL